MGTKRVFFIKRYFQESTKSHAGYAIKFFLCEVLALVNVVGQIYFTDKFLGNEFTTYGWDVLSVTAGNPEDRADPMNVVFPKVTKCTFHKYGPSGTITKHDGLCILALNIINEKIYVFLWFWFVSVAMISALALLYRVVIFLMPSIRVTVIMGRSLYQVEKRTVEDVLNCPRHSWVDKIGDYFVMYLLTKNLPPIAMKELLEELRPVMQPSKTINNYQPSNFEKDSPM